MADSHKNFAYSTVASAPSPADSGTSLDVQSGHGTRFPTPPFYASVWPANQLPLPTNAEIVRVTAISTDTFTITRTQESTSARSIQVGDQIAATITVATLEQYLPLSGGDLTGDLTQSSGNIRTAGYLRVGSTSAPTNTTAGDITGVRLAIGDNTAFSDASGQVSKLAGTLTATSGASSANVYTTTVNAASNSTAQFRSFNATLLVDSSNTSAYTSGTGLISFYGEANHKGSGNITHFSTAYYINFFGTNFTGTVSNAYNMQLFPASATGGTPTGTITTARAIKIGNSVVGSGPLVIGTQIGIDIDALTAATTDIGIRIAKADTYSLQLSDTGGTAAGGITFGTDVTLYRSAANVLKTDDKLLITLDAEIDGALDHDGSTAGFFGTTPATQQTGIVDADGTLADVTSKFNSLLSKLETYGLLAAA